MKGKVAFLFFFLVNFGHTLVTAHLSFQVVVDCPSSGEQQVFLCQKWLADDEGDQLIERDLYESEDMRLKRRPSMQFKVFSGNLTVKKDPSLGF